MLVMQVFGKSLQSAGLWRLDVGNRVLFESLDDCVLKKRIAECGAGDLRPEGAAGTSVPGVRAKRHR